MQNYYILYDTSLPPDVRFWLFDWLEVLKQETRFQAEIAILGYSKDAGYSAIEEVFRIFEPKNASIFLLSDSDNCDVRSLLGRWGCPLVDTPHNPLATHAMARLLEANNARFFPIANAGYRDTQRDYLDLADLTGGKGYELAERNDGLIIREQLALASNRAAVPEPASIVALLVLLGLILLFVRRHERNRTRTNHAAPSGIARGLRAFRQRLGNP